MNAPNVQYVANNGNVIISQGNPNLDGSGPLGSLLTAGGNGATVNSITIKAMGATSQGMVRLFASNGSQNLLIREIMVPANVQSPIVQAFSATIVVPFTLAPGYSLKVSTQNDEPFSVSASATNWINCACPQ